MSKLQEKMEKLVKVKKIEKDITLNSEIVLAEFNFNKLNLERDMISFLKEQTLKIKEITVKSHTELGKIFFETQKKLSNHRDGCFEEWYLELGFKKQSVYNYINRYSFILENMDKKILIESLPLKLVYQIANPNCPSELVELVLAGEIKNYNDYLTLKEPVSKPEEIQIVDEINKNEIYEVQKKVDIVIAEKIEQLDEKKKKKIYSLYKEIEKLLK